MKPFSFIENARTGNNQWYLYLIGLVLVILANMLGSLPFTYVVWNRVGDGAGLSQAEMLDPTMLGISPALGLLLLMFPFAVGLLALWGVIRLLHGRSFLSLLTPKTQLDWGKILFGGGLWLGLTMGLEGLVFLYQPENYSWAFDPQTFFPVLLVALIFVPLQTSMEEVLFRGYLLQGLGLWWRRPLVAMILTAVCFGMLHWTNPEIAEFGGMIILFYVGFGLVMGLCTLMDDSLELALGVHAANNLYGALLVTFAASALQTPALVTLETYPVALMTFAWFVASVLFVFLASRKYGWKNWGKLGGSISEPEEEETIA